MMRSLVVPGSHTIADRSVAVDAAMDIRDSPADAMIASTCSVTTAPAGTAKVALTLSSTRMSNLS